MLMESYRPIGIEDPCSFLSDLGNNAVCLTGCSGETWQMDLKSDTNSAFGCGAAIATTEEMPQTHIQCSLNLNQNYSQLSGVCTTSESSAPNFVYRRRRLSKSPAPLPVTQATANASHDLINFVYERRKRQRSIVTSFSTVAPAHASPNGVCTIRLQFPSVAAVERNGGSHETETTRVSSMSAVVSNNLLAFTSETVDGCLAEGHGSAVKNKVNKTMELISVDDSCSSSTLDMGNGSVPIETQIDDTDECSSSGVLAADGMRDNLSLSTTDLCISILKNHGLLPGSGPNSSGASEEDTPSCSGSRGSRPCNLCGVSGIAEDMLICDECEEAFHISCCNPIIRKMPVDDWYCQSCFRKTHVIIKKKAVKKSSIIRSEKGSVTSEGDLSPIALMLNGNEPYTTGVRVGKGFQAIVPEWSGPITEDADIPEPVELDPSYTVNLPEVVSSKPCRSNFVGNWLQCRAVIVGMGEGADGTVCGKWRRGPLFEVQTDNWDCFHSVLWDPTHADCAVPQELETEEVLKQLKYVEMLRPRLALKKRKLKMCNVDDSTVRADDASNCTGSTNAAKNL